LIFQNRGKNKKEGAMQNRNELDRYHDVAMFFCRKPLSEKRKVLLKMAEDNALAIGFTKQQLAKSFLTAKHKVREERHRKDKYYKAMNFDPR